MNKQALLLNKKSFRNFLIADVISGFGVGMTTVGANWYLLLQTHFNQLVGIYLTINVLSGFLVSPLAGAITDKYSRKRVILWTFITRAFLISIVAVYFYFSGFSILMMYFLSIVTGAGWITYMAASRSYVQDILPKEQFGSANSFIEVSLQVGMFSAGAISGFLLNYTGFLIILIINICLFFFASVLILTIENDRISQMNPSGAKGNFVSGIKYILNKKTIMNAGLLSILPLIITQLFNVSSPDYVASTLHATSIVYGMADMFYGIGGLVAGIMVGLLLNQFQSKKLIILFFFLAGSALFLLYLKHYVTLMYICTFILGLSNSSLRVIINTILMAKIEPAFMGRATALWNGIAQFMEVFAAILIGMLNDRFGASLGFLVMFFIMFFGMIWSAIGLTSPTTDKKRGI